MTESAPDQAAMLADQLSWHWTSQARPRLQGLDDTEYLWEPVAGCWSIRLRGEGVATEVGPGEAIIDFDFAPGDPPPVTTIAWRLAHLTVGVFGARNATYFGGPAISYDSYDYPLSAKKALADLDAGYTRWIDGVQALSPAELDAPCREVGFESDSLARLVLHINREAIHHLAETALLRDLYAHRQPGG